MNAPSCPPPASPCPCPPSPSRGTSRRTIELIRIPELTSELICRLRCQLRSEFNNESVRADNADRLPGESFYTTNEARHYLWHDRVQNLGGIMIGIATHQSYILAGWARPERVLLVDFDINIVRLHKAYRVCFEIAKTPEEFIHIWNEENILELEKGIRHAYENDTDCNGISELAQNQSRILFLHLRNTQTIHRTLNSSTFLTNQSQYDFVANLSRMGYVTPVCGDVFGNKTMFDIALTATKNSFPVRLLYLSNLEDHFKYNKRFRENIGYLPFDSRSLVLRTCFPGVWENKFNLSTAREGTHFCTQHASDFLAWLDDPRTLHISDIFAVQNTSNFSNASLNLYNSSEKLMMKKLRRNFTLGRDIEFTCYVFSSPVEHVLGSPNGHSSYI